MSSAQSASARPPSSACGNKERALKEKELGNSAYKVRQFDKAVAHFKEAIKLDPFETTFRSNLAAMLLEKKE